ncbi:helix-turn-helix transcriptional regulator [Halorarius litoreus]|uniref:helix-turn-helix transcriptional regulator n=1 Tax=Halorarius litoreus TaxID=2962676 RepID=UPI0020CE8360|nr:hypothetical protein [Halorarius litoreus]
MSEYPVSVLPLFSRREPLISLLREGAHSKPELVRSLDISRSTVDRCIRELESAELGERTDGGFRLTLAGRLLFDEYEQFRERVDGVFETIPLLSVLSLETDIDAAALRGAEVTLTDRTAPYRPAESYLDHAQEAQRVDHLMTALGPNYVDGLRSTVLDDGVEVRLAASQSVTKRLVGRYSDVLDELFATGRLLLRQLESHPGYSLGLVTVDDTTSLHYLVYTDDGLRGRIETSHPEAVEVARQQFERYWRDGMPVDRSER